MTGISRACPMTLLLGEIVITREHGNGPSCAAEREDILKWRKFNVSMKSNDLGWKG